jgi:uncharacterized lipoprotein YajG
MKSLVAVIATVILCAGLIGCATTRSELSIAAPAPAKVPAAKTGKTIYIRTVTDGRVFEQAPKQANIPSLGFEGAEKATAEIRARAIGRKRGGFGKAFGDVLLEEGQTVSGLVRQHLTRALEQAGYQVVNDAANAPALDVHIKQFWTWVSPGFWQISLTTHITTDLAFSGQPNPIVIDMEKKEGFLVIVESDWIKVVGQALDEYRNQVVAKTANKL